MIQQHNPKRARHLLVVALHKSGTHLIAKLLQALGYNTVGDGLDNRPPSWSEQINTNFLAKFPENTAFFFHGMALDHIPLGLAERWTHNHQPPILFHYRDPRAVLVSLVNYLLRRSTGKGFSRTTYQIMLADLLQQTPAEERLARVMTCYPEYFQVNFERQQWLLHHPSVCKTHFEALVGERGGGDAQQQRNAIQRVMQHCRIDGDPNAAADQLFDPSQRTFHKGQAHAWRDVFRDQDLALFNQRFGHILDAYEYPRIDAGSRAADPRPQVVSE